MALYCYIKKKKLPDQPAGRSIVRILPYGLIVTGISLIFIVIYPFVSYKFDLSRWKEESLIVPVPEIAIVEAKGFISPVSTKETKNKDDSVKVINEVDYNLISNWFPASTLPSIEQSKVTHYSLSIPKLKIDKATVTIGGKKLSDTLIQYPGTALPGEFGNAVIFGHSVLPTFYNPSDYKAIFSLLPTLEKNDKIIIEYDGMQFTYKVQDYYEKKPEEIDVLEQHFDRQFLSLVTCVPPGTYLRRGVITASLDQQ